MNNTKPNKSSSNLEALPIWERSPCNNTTNFSDFLPESPEQRNLREYLFSGQSFSGKSLLISICAALTRLYADPTALLIDAEEGANHAFAKTHETAVKKIRLMMPDDYDHLVVAQDSHGMSKALVDLPGTSLEGVRRAINFGRLSETNVEIIPIIVVGLRANAVEVAQNWVELYADNGVKKLYWVWNNQDTASPDNRELPELPPNSPTIVEIRIPALKSEIAKILVSEGINPLEILGGGYKDRPELSNRNALGELGGWLRQFAKAAQPLLEDIKN